VSGNKHLVGSHIVDHKKNTNRAKHVNDRLRRRAKRLERAEVERLLESGELYFSSLFRQG